MNIRVEFHADVTEFEPAVEQKEFAELLNRKLNDTIVDVLKMATERTGLIPMQNDLHLTGKTWQGKAECELKVSKLDPIPTEVEKTYDDPKTIPS